ncbi:MAG TPA: CrcB family protein [Phycisphaerae bacterium]|jgi:CrcB protein|nr:CrcB family protein [Phycisphaerae bacterium]
MHKTVWVMIGVTVFGGLGSLARFGVVEFMLKFTKYPAGTLAVNVLGAFLIGWVFSALANPPTGETNFWRIVLATGFLGGFTTFSSMVNEADGMMNNAAYLRAAGYLAASLFLGLVAVRLGSIVGKAM